jgi:hypothetical protein
VLGIDSRGSFLKGVLAGIALSMLALLGTAYYLGQRDRHVAAVAPTVDGRHVPNPKPESLWSYSDEVDSVTKAVVSKVSAQLPATGIGEDVVADLTWSCPERTIDSTTLEVVTFHKVDSGKYVALPQSPTLGVEYRFDGEVRTVSGVWPTGIIAREYINSIKLTIASIFGGSQNPGRFTTTKPNQPHLRMRDFYVVDPDFAVRIPVDGGRVMVQISLEDAMIKKILTECGFTYGAPPQAAHSRALPTR